MVTVTRTQYSQPQETMIELETAELRQKDQGLNQKLVNITIEGPKVTSCRHLKCRLVGGSDAKVQNAWTAGASTLKTDTLLV
eukprot:6481530-Amphidinium_carterae.1